MNAQKQLFNSGIKEVVYLSDKYEGNDIFRCLVADNGIMPYIKLRRNARVKKTNHIFRNLSVMFQKNNLQEWKDSVSYGQRWIAENRIFLYKENVWRVCLFR